MLALTVITALGGFMLGAYLTYRYAPPLAGGAASIALGLVVCALVGAAVGLLCMYIYIAIYELVNQPQLDIGLFGSGSRHSISPDANIFVSAVYSIATQSGVLLALAAGIFLLAPASRQTRPG
jgi:uncharacterized integral membrane protein